MNLKHMREAGDVEGVSAILEVCLRSNFAGIENPRLYSETYYGTKDRICEYIEEGELSRNRKAFLHLTTDASY